MQLLAVPQDAERVRAKAAAGRFNDGQHSGSGDSRVYGVAALLQDRQAGLGREGLRCGDDILGQNGRAARRIDGIMT